MSEKCTRLDWYDNTKKCPECGGDVHAHFGDENYDGDYWLEYHCHICGAYFSEYDWDKMGDVEDESKRRSREASLSNMDKVD